MSRVYSGLSDFYGNNAQTFDLSGFPVYLSDRG
jgi:hypothetical protein